MTKKKNMNEGASATNKRRTYNIIGIIKLKSQRGIFIKLTIIFICSAFSYFGIILNLGRMKGNFFLNAIFAFLGEIVAETTFGVLADKYGRVITLQCTCLLGAIGYVLFTIVPVVLKEFFLFIAMLGFAGLWTVISIYTPEVYPTKIRNIAFAYSGFISRLCPIFVPILSRKFGDLIDVAFILCGVIPFLFGFTLEETLYKTILDVIPEELEMNHFENDIKMNFINRVSIN